MTTWTITHTDAIITADPTEAREIIAHLTSKGIAPTIEITDAPAADTYTIEITVTRQRANAMPRPSVSATVTDPDTGETATVNHCWNETEARERAAALIERIRSGEHATMLANSAAARVIRAGEHAKAEAATKAAQAATQAVDPASQEPTATGNQIEYIVSLLARRARSGEGGGFMSTRGLYRKDGTIDRTAIAAMTRRNASALIDSLRGNY